MELCNNLLHKFPLGIVQQVQPGQEYQIVSRPSRQLGSKLLPNLVLMHPHLRQIGLIDLANNLALGPRRKLSDA